MSDGMTDQRGEIVRQARELTPGEEKSLRKIARLRGHIGRYRIGIQDALEATDLTTAQDKLRALLTLEMP